MLFVLSFKKNCGILLRFVQISRNLIHVLIDFRILGILW